MPYNFYKPLYNPNSLSGTVGGAISTTGVSGYLGELFYHVSAPPSGLSEFSQYRKIFVKNEFSSPSTETKIWVDQADHPEQIYLSREGSVNDTSTSPTGAPAGTSWSYPSDYSEGIQIGTLSVNQSTGIWIKQKLTGIIIEDPFASFRLYVGGLVS